MSRSGDFGGDDDRQTNRQTDYFTPAHARGVKIHVYTLYPWKKLKVKQERSLIL